jgi:Carboxypeptidase regulatory-like domain
MTKSLRFASVAGLALLLAISASAQKKDKQDANTRSLQGTVTDSTDKPVSGAVVQLKDARTLQVRSFISQGDGAYHFSGLKTENDYQVKADHDDQSSGWKTLSIFDTRKAPVLNLKLDKK